LKPPPFKYVSVASVAEAVSALAAGAGEAKLLAGGQSLVPMLNFRLLAPEFLVDINRIPGLDAIREVPDGGLRIGALARHHALETSALVAERFPVLAAAMRHVAHLAVRNRGSIGGSLAHGDPAAELPLLALLLGARITAVGIDGNRQIDATDFFEGALTTALTETEVVTEITLPALPPGTGWGFEEVARRSGDFALAAVAATLTRAGEAVGEARLAVTGAGETPLRIITAENLLKGKVPDPEAIESAATLARDSVQPNDDLHASADYRRHLVGVLSQRALNAAWRRACEAAP
jgi:carbon-monoxide dehydrogenase medium subunit